MEALFSNKSILDKSAVEKFNKLIGKKLTAYGIVLVMAFCGVVGGLLCLVNLFLGIAVIGVGALIGCPLTAYLIKDAMKKDAEKLLGGKKYLVNFDFYDDKVAIKAEEADEGASKYTYSGEEEFPYQDILKIIVNDVEIYIQRAGQANILDQRGMSQGTAGELIEFLRGKGVKIEGAPKAKQ